MDTMEDFNNSESWLSEELFTQLKELSGNYKYKNTMELMMNGTYQKCSNSMPLLEEDEMQPQDLTKAHLVSFEAAFQKNNLLNCGINSEVLDLSNTTGMHQSIEIIEPKKSLIDLLATISLVPEPLITKAAAVSEEGKQSELTAFNPSEEELKILKFLEIQPKDEYIDENIFIPELPSTSYRIVKCANCNSIFNIISFQSHICDYDEHHNLILPQVPNYSAHTKPIKPEPVLPPEPACLRLLRENQIRIRRFLKDELKYDVNAVSNNNTCTNTYSNTTSVSGPASLSLNSLVSPISSTSNTKKLDGPHECNLCERKFVHASGLLRHMEKHAMDLIPSNNTYGNKSTTLQGNSLNGVNGLRVVIKCTLCGRIFFEPNAALKHLCSHFPYTETDETEMDNFADIPYDAYVDDALNYLKIKAQGTLPSSCNDVNSTNYHEDKPTTYVKIVILSCLLQCEFCDLLFSEASYLFVHSACHLPERRFECFACNIHVKTSKEMCTHWQVECVFMRENLKVHQATTQRYFACNVCENKFQSLDQLHEHRYTSYHFFPRLNKHMGILQLPCEYCDSVFENAHDCVTHYEEKHYKKYKRDNVSGGSSKTRLYLCEICGKSYTQSSHLWQHLRFHQGVKPFACKEPGCTRKFTIRPDLNDHIRKCHTGERPYHCLVCGKRFLTGSVFYQHRLIHRGERRYECEECGKRFYRADALKNHQRIHTGEKPFGCLFCTKNFRQRGDRDKHIKARHSHLDANARLMMQMQKIQLEAAAAATNYKNYIIPDNSYNNENIPPPMPLPSSSALYNTSNFHGSNDIAMFGDVAVARSMFDSLIPLDFDEDTALKAIQQQIK